MKARPRGTGRNSVVGLGSSGMMVMVSAGWLDLFFHDGARPGLK